MRTIPSNAAFTAIELLMVLAVMIILSAMAVPSAVTALRASRVTAGAEVLVEVVEAARTLAREAVELPAAAPTPEMGEDGRKIPAGQAFGVVIQAADGATPGYVGLLRGDDVSPTSEWLQGGQPVLRKPLPSQALPWVDGAPMAPGARFGFFFATGSGAPLKKAIGSLPDNVGITAIAAVPLRTVPVAIPGRPAVPASGIATELSMRSPDGRTARAIAVYRSGLVSVAVVP